MNWKFWKSKPEPRKLYAPKGEVRELLELWDRYNAAPCNADSLLRYTFWKKAAGILPELEADETSWFFVAKARDPYFTNKRP